MTDEKTIVLATRNPGKLRELARILGAEEPGGTQVRLAGLDEFPGAPDVPETGATFEANPLRKARAIAACTRPPPAAHDSPPGVDAISHRGRAFRALAPFIAKACQGS